MVAEMTGTTRISAGCDEQQKRYEPLKPLLEESGYEGSLLNCPNCGEFSYTHLMRTTVHSRRNGEDSDSDAINVTTDGRVHVSRDVPNPSPRRDSVVLHFVCEFGCLFDIRVIQHKGQTFFEVETLRLGPDIE